jgi:hypothetical protein
LAENKNVEKRNEESRGAAKHVGDAVGGGSNFEIIQVIREKV